MRRMAAHELALSKMEGSVVSRIRLRTASYNPLAGLSDEGLAYAWWTVCIQSSIYEADDTPGRRHTSLVEYLDR